MMTIILTAIITFVITALWSRYTKIKGYAPLFINFTLLVNELDNLAKKAGSEDLYSYWVKTKGEDYANTAMQNIKHTLDFLKDRYNGKP